MLSFEVTMWSPTSKLTPELSVSTLNRMLDVVTQMGLDAVAILQRAGVSATPEELRAGSAMKLHPSRFDAIYAQCILAMEANANLQSGRLSLERNEHRMMCYSIINCATLHEAILRASEFLQMLAPRAGMLFLRLENNIAELEQITYRRQRSASAFVSDMVGLSTFHQLFGWLIGQRIDLLEAETLYSPVFEPLLFLAHFPVPLQFGGRGNRVTFSAEILSRPIVRTYPELVELLEVFPFAFNGPEYRLRTVSEHVRCLCSKALCAQEPPPTLQSLAGVFNQSVSTFRRRLADEGTSLNDIKRDCRQSMAVKLLGRGDLSVSEVASRLGFADSATFRRAFKEWTGQAPADYRRPGCHDQPEGRHARTFHA
jgi:AraC-like DNA-binding protein